MPKFFKAVRIASIAVRAAVSTVAPPLGEEIAPACTTGVTPKTLNFCVAAVPIFVPTLIPN